MLQCHQSQVAFPNKNARTNEKLTYISLVNSARHGMFYIFGGRGSTLPRCLATSYDIKLPERNKLWLPENSQTCTVTFLNMSLRDMRNRENDKTIKVWPPTTWTSQKPSWKKWYFYPKKPLRRTANVVLIFFFSELLMYELQSHRGIFPNFRAQLQRILRWGPGQEQFPRNTGDFGVSFQGAGTPNAWGGLRMPFIYIYTLEVQPPFFIGWFPNHHYFRMDLSSFKRKHHFFNGDWLPGYNLYVYIHIYIYKYIYTHEDTLVEIIYLILHLGCFILMLIHVALHGIHRDW